MVTNPNDVRLTVLAALQEAHDEEACLEEQILSLMHRFADRFTNRRLEINRLMILHDHPLIEYGRYALGRMTGADMKKATYLKSVRDELLRSMEKKATTDDKIQRNIKPLLLKTSLITMISQEITVTKFSVTYNGIFWDGSVNYGGYSEMLVADHRYVVHVPESLPMDAAAPLLCAGITVYSPMIDNKLHESSGKRIGIVGLGGLGHIAVKFGKAFGHHVSVISTSPSKEKEAKQGLGADDFIISTDPEQMMSKKRTLDFMLDTVSGPHSLGPTLELLKVNGTLVLLSVPDKPVELPSFPLILGKRVVKAA
ncbi:probable cinnamyl alcohol dehydrogenase 6 [Tanacetum coccineum]|uniref:Probable cinnamyl alcohol dehydrogenase 6 n=1 Tax=Tanacetum coccineum TaxID=301880 RepID=A0ABQ4X8D4_9ASTR